MLARGAYFHEKRLPNHGYKQTYPQLWWINIMAIDILEKFHRGGSAVIEK